MAATTKDRVGRLVKAEPRGHVMPVKLAADEVFYMNTLAGIVASTGFAEPLNGAAAASFYSKVVFIERNFDTTGESDGDTTADARVGCIVKLKLASAVQADQGDVVYALDNQSVTKTAGDKVALGHIVSVESATEVFVFISPENI